MTDDNDNYSASPLDALRRYVPLAVWAMVILVILAIPFRIISYGYLPPDDALRHAAKAVSGKPWPEILVVGPVFQIDHNYGWHLILRQIHLWSQCGTEGLVIFAVVALFLLAAGSPLPWLKRPEAWLVVLTAVGLTSDIIGRFAIGRPFLLTIAGLLTILFFWEARGPAPAKWWMLLWMAPLIAICTFVHGVWYLWTLLIAAFLLARQFRWAAVLTVSWLVGVFLGAALTGHPLAALLQAVEMAQRAFAMHSTQRTLVSEFQPSSGTIFALVMLGGLLILRQLARLNARPLTADPAFWLAGLGWVLGFKAGRFMEDWGWPALMVLMTCDLQLLLQARFAADSFKRLALAGGLAVMTFLAITNDGGSRWTYNLTQQYLTSDNPDLNGWMPEKGGIIYSGDMTIFYQTFFKNPKADWRYILGYEAALMSKADFEVYHKILWNFGDVKAFQPWVDKMRPPDRLILRGGRSSPPNISQLEWEYGVSGTWIGRTPRIPQSGTPAPTIPAKATSEDSTNAVNSAK